MMVLTKEQIDDMRVSLGKGAQPFTKEAIESLCAMAQGAITAPRAEAGAPRPVFVGVWGPEQIAAMRDCKPGDIQVVYPLDEEWNKALQAALDCYSPDDSATDWALKISYLKRIGVNNSPSEKP